MSQLHLSLLGTPEIRHQEQVLKFRTRKELALLVYLAVEGGTHSREKLIALFWPDLDETRGRVILRRTLALLRKALEEASAAPHKAHLVVERHALGLRHASSVKGDFYLLNSVFARIPSRLALGKIQGEERRLLVEQLQEVLSLVRGMFLEDFLLPDAPAFDSWVNTQREAIRRRLSVLFDTLSSLQMEGGEISDAIEATTRWVDYDPGDERAARKLMQLYFIANRRDEALRVYEATRTWLSRELNVEPAPETLALAERIRREQPTRLPRQQRTSLQSSSISLDGPLIGRADEYTSLVERYYHLKNRETHLALIEGETGIGKTRLVMDFLGWVTTQGADVLQGRAFESGSHIAYQLVADMLRPRMELENAPEDLLSDTWLSELSRILPELRDRYPDLPVPLVDESTGQTRLFEAVGRLIQAWASRRPLVIFLDDLQWADIASRDLLYYALRQWKENQLPILLIANIRAETLRTMPDLQALLFRLRHDMPTLVLSLNALRYEDVAQWMQFLDEHALEWESENITRGELVPATTNVAPFVHWLFDKTQGHPLYIKEMLRVLLERQLLKTIPRPDGTWTIDTSITAPEIARWQHILPSRIHDTIRMRLASLTPIARVLLSGGAVLCHDFTFDLLRQVTELQDNDVLQGLDEVLSHHLLIEQVDHTSSSREVTYSFPHDMLRDVIYIEAGESRRRVFHGRMLQRLQTTSVPAGLLAYHALGAGQPDQVIHWSLRAGDEAMRSFSIHDAIPYYEQAQRLLTERRETSAAPLESTVEG